MLREGAIDAAILGEVPAADSPLKPLIPDPAAAARDWQRRHGAIQINHMVVVTAALAQSAPDAVREAYRLLVESKRAAGLPVPGELDTTPFGLEANRRNLEVAIDCVVPAAAHPAAVHGGRALRRRHARPRVVRGAGRRAAAARPAARACAVRFSHRRGQPAGI